MAGSKLADGKGMGTALPDAARSIVGAGRAMAIELACP
jgi:hypothetical protein